MYVSPDIHIVISTTEEVVRMVCITVGFVVAVWGTVKIAGLLLKRKNNE